MSRTKSLIRSVNRLTRALASSVLLALVPAGAGAAPSADPEIYVEPVWKVVYAPEFPARTTANQLKKMPLGRIYPVEAIRLKADFFAEDEKTGEKFLVLRSGTVLARVLSNTQQIYCAWNSAPAELPSVKDLNLAGRIFCLYDENADGNLDIYFSKFSMAAPTLTFNFGKPPGLHRLTSRIAYETADPTAYQYPIDVKLSIWSDKKAKNGNSSCWALLHLNPERRELIIREEVANCGFGQQVTAFGMTLSVNMTDPKDRDVIFDKAIEPKGIPMGACTSC